MFAPLVRQITQMRFSSSGVAGEEKAIQLFQSQEFREATAHAGVKVPPEVSYLDEVADLAA